jgi:hypothetical protein
VSQPNHQIAPAVRSSETIVEVGRGNQAHNGAVAIPRDAAPEVVRLLQLAAARRVEAAELNQLVEQLATEFAPGFRVKLDRHQLRTTSQPLTPAEIAAEINEEGLSAQLDYIAQCIGEDFARAELERRGAAGADERLQGLERDLLETRQSD